MNTQNNCVLFFMDPFLQKHKMDTKHVQQITWQQESSAQDRPLNDVLSIHAYIYVYQYRIKHCLTIRQVLKAHLHFLCFLTELILKNVPIKVLISLVNEAVNTSKLPHSDHEAELHHAVLTANIKRDEDESAHRHRSVSSCVWTFNLSGN